jgi:hypothetical protein
MAGHPSGSSGRLADSDALAVADIDVFDLDLRLGELEVWHGVAPALDPQDAQSDPAGCIPTGGAGAEGGTCDTQNDTCPGTCQGHNTCGNTCPDTCPHTCPDTCRDTCGETCAGDTCDTCDTCGTICNTHCNTCHC